MAGMCFANQVLSEPLVGVLKMGSGAIQLVDANRFLNSENRLFKIVCIYFAVLAPTNRLLNLERGLQNRLLRSLNSRGGVLEDVLGLEDVLEDTF